MRDLRGRYLEIWCEIDLDAFGRNIDKIRSIAKGREIILAVKANAYGHGVVHIAKEAEHKGIRHFGVATVEEGIALREAGIKGEIIVLTPVSLEQIDDIIRYNLTPNIVTRLFAEALSAKGAEVNRAIPCHIEVDTGMGRTGFFYEDVMGELISILRLPFLDVRGIFSHFPVADSADEDDIRYTYEQINRFKWLLEILKKLGFSIPLYHIANSAGLLDYPEFGNAVRPGILAYGLYPSKETKHIIEVEPILSFRAKLVQIQEFPQGWCISYGRTYRLKEKTTIGVIRAGYGDGLRRTLSNKGMVIIRGEKYPIVGNVCMDMTMCKIGNNSEVQLDDDVTIIGRDGDETITADDHADWINTINYEVLTGISVRVPRLYFKNGQLVGQDGPNGYIAINNV